MFFYINTKIKYFIKKMKSIILLITLLAPLIVSKTIIIYPSYKSEDQVYNDIIKNVNAKIGYSLKLEKGKNYIQPITALPIPENVKNWVKKVDVSRKNSVANIDYHIKVFLQIKLNFNFNIRIKTNNLIFFVYIYHNI